MWGKNNIEWNNVDPRVNILVGPNGSGKSTFLQLIRLLLLSDKELNKLKTDILIQFDSGANIHYRSERKDFLIEMIIPWDLDVVYINTFDVPTNKKSAQSSLMQELDMTIYPINKTVFNFIDYRSMILNHPEQANEIQERIAKLFEIIDGFFATTGKQVSINSKNKMVFTCGNGNEEIDPEQLSSGEKQLLLILLKVFLKENKPFFLLMDEPEMSLHMEWQKELIGSILELNENCQIILSTHSPSIFADGWGDKLVFMEDIIKPSQEEDPQILVEELNTRYNETIHNSHRPFVWSRQFHAIQGKNHHTTTFPCVE